MITRGALGLIFALVACQAPDGSSGGSAAPDSLGAARDTASRAPARGQERAPPVDTTGGSRLPSERRDAWLRSAFLPSTATPADIVERFGEPDRRTATPTANRHVPGQTDSIVTLEYDRGLRLELYSVAGGRDLLREAEVTAPGILESDVVDVGVAWAVITRRMGQPQGRRGGMPYYLCGSCMGAEEPVFFAVEDGVVRRIRFSYYVD